MNMEHNIDIYKRTDSEDGIGSGGDYNWDTSRETDVPARVVKRDNLPEVREQIGGQVDVQYEWLCFVPRYDEGSERGIEKSDKVEWDEWSSGKATITGILKSNLHFILALHQPEEV